VTICKAEEEGGTENINISGASQIPKKLWGKRKRVETAEGRTGVDTEGVGNEFNLYVGPTWGGRL